MVCFIQLSFHFTITQGNNRQNFNTERVWGMCENQMSRPQPQNIKRTYYALYLTLRRIIIFVELKPWHQPWLGGLWVFQQVDSPSPRYRPFRLLWITLKSTRLWLELSGGTSRKPTWSGSCCTTMLRGTWPRNCWNFPEFCRFCDPRWWTSCRRGSGTNLPRFLCTRRVGRWWTLPIRCRSWRGRSVHAAGSSLGRLGRILARRRLSWWFCESCPVPARTLPWARRIPACTPPRSGRSPLHRSSDVGQWSNFHRSRKSHTEHRTDHLPPDWPSRNPEISLGHHCMSWSVPSHQPELCLES